MSEFDKYSLSCIRNGKDTTWSLHANYFTTYITRDTLKLMVLDIYDYLVKEYLEDKTKSLSIRITAYMNLGAIKKYIEKEFYNYSWILLSEFKEKINENKTLLYYTNEEIGFFKQKQ